MKLNIIAVSIAFVLILSLAYVHVRDMLAGQREEIFQLTAMLDKGEENDSLRAELDRAYAEISAVKEAQKLALDTVEVLEDRLDNAEKLAGMTAVRGPGVTVTVHDSSNSGVVHDSDLLMLVNELRDAGAEALSVNGERILATSEIRCAGAIVSINNSRYAAPFVINAIGDTETMYNALHMTGGVLDVLSQWKLNAAVEKSDELFIEAYDGKTVFVFARS